MEEKTCMEYLFQSVQSNHINDINQNILFNASNEFRNLWNLVKKLRDLARVDVQKITRFLDSVQVGLEKKDWNAAARNCLQAENEYRQIRRYIRPSFLEDFRVSLFIENVDSSGKSKSATKREKKPPSSGTKVHRKPNFRNKQINKQEKSNDVDDTTRKKPNDTINDSEKRDGNVKFKAKEKIADISKPTKEKVSKDTSKGEKPSNVNNTEEINSINSGVKDELKDTKSCDRLAAVHSETETKTTALSPKSVDVAANSSHRNAKIGTSSESKKPNDKENPKKNDEGKTKEIEVATNTTDEVNKQTNAGTVSDTAGCENLQRNDVGHIENNSLSHDKEGVVQDQQCTKNETRDAGKQKSMNISELLSVQMTEISFECKPEEIITELELVFDTDWSLAFKALTGCKPSNGNKNTIDFLGEILKLSACDVRKTAETLNGKASSSVSESLENLKKKFLTWHLKDLQTEHSIVYHNGTDDEYTVNLYSAKCVELSWFMFTRQPPMVFDYDSRPMLMEELYEIFKPYKNSGHNIHYVVWPAIRRCHGGKVVAKGIADFR